MFHVGFVELVRVYIAVEVFVLTFSHCFYVYTKVVAHNLHLHLLAVIALVLTSCLYHWHTNIQLLPHKNPASRGMLASSFEAPRGINDIQKNIAHSKFGIGAQLLSFSLLTVINFVTRL